jgi:hypothetical protein
VCSTLNVCISNQLSSCVCVCVSLFSRHAFIIKCKFGLLLGFACMIRSSCYISRNSAYTNLILLSGEILIALYLYTVDIAIVINTFVFLSMSVLFLV